MTFRSLLRGGTIVFDDFIVDPEVPLSSQLDELKADMLQVEFGDRYILDVGWYPSFSPQGHFVVRVICDFDWEEPVFKATCHTLSDLSKVVEEGVKVIEGMMN